MRTSPTTSTLSVGDVPGHGSFILAPDPPNDWRSPQNDYLWQGMSGTNNPCPEGFRLPTESELETERDSWTSNNAAGAFASPLKLPAGGLRDPFVGMQNGVGSDGVFWSSTINATNARYLVFSSDAAFLSTNNRGFGMSLRCIKD